MKVLVPVKRVIDYNVKVRVKADGSGVDLANVKMSMNPFDEIAVEQAIRLKEAGQADEVIAVSIGVKQSQETLRTALAMGADRAILVVATEDVQTDIEPLAVAKILKAVIDEEKPGIVLAGKQAIDNDMNATGQMLAALTGWSQATFVSELSVEGNSAVVTREVDGGLQTIKVTMPTIVTVDLRLNEPRYASLPNIMKAKKKPLDEKSAEDLGVDVTPRLKIESTGEPEARLAGIKVGYVDSVVLDSDTYYAGVKLYIEKAIEIPEDSRAIVATSGLLGGKYIRISPGGAEENLKNEGRIKFTQSSLNIEDLIGKLMYSLTSK